MDLATAIAGVLQERSALQQMDGTPNPSYLSQHMQLLSQYNSVLEDLVSEKKKKLELHKAELFEQYREKGMSVNASEVQTKYDVVAERVEVNRLQTLINSSWSFVSATQSRIKHLIAESQNQI